MVWLFFISYWNYLLSWKVVEADSHFFGFDLLSNIGLFFLKIALNFNIVGEEWIVHVDDDAEVLAIRYLGCAFFKWNWMGYNQFFYWWAIVSDWVQAWLQFFNALNFDFVVQALSMVEEHLHLSDALMLDSKYRQLKNDFVSELDVLFQVIRLHIQSKINMIIFQLLWHYLHVRLKPLYIAIVNRLIKYASLDITNGIKNHMKLLHFKCLRLLQLVEALACYNF